MFQTNNQITISTHISYACPHEKKVGASFSHRALSEYCRETESDCCGVQKCWLVVDLPL